LKISLPNVKRVICDFEKGIANAASRVFFNSQIQGCVFHFSQSLWKKIQDIGLVTLYKDDITFQTIIRMIFNLVYIPLPDIHSAYEIILRKIIQHGYKIN
jgi:hypothetical protein